MSGKTHKIKIVLLQIMSLIMILLLCGCQPGADRSPKGPPLKLTLALQPAPYSGLIAIADEKGYFKEEGLEVSMVFHPSGRACLEAVSRGEAQVGTVSDIAFAAKAIEEPSIRIIASIGTTIGSEIIARKDRNIQNPPDLRGKRVGFSSGTTSDYFLYTFLIKQHIPQEDIRLVDIPASRQVEAIVNGEVDAISIFDIYTFEAKDHLGENAISWDAHNNLAYHWLLAVQENLIKTPEPLKRFIRALIKSQDFARTNNTEVKNIISRKWSLNPALVQQAWPKTRLKVFFSQSIITSLQHYTKWHISKMDKPAVTPDILGYLHSGILNEVDSGLVTIYR
jgi:NitT/TauT family transport system substrate-binding protein